MTKKSENDKRAKRCVVVLSDYGTDNTYVGCLTDFLTDARHWCDRNKQCFGDIDRMAHQHYLAELHDERQGGCHGRNPQSLLRRPLPSSGAKSNALQWSTLCRASSGTDQCQSGAAFDEPLSFQSGR